MRYVLADGRTLFAGCSGEGRNDDERLPPTALEGVIAAAGNNDERCGAKGDRVLAEEKRPFSGDDIDDFVHSIVNVRRAPFTHLQQAHCLLGRARQDRFLDQLLTDEISIEKIRNRHGDERTALRRRRRRSGFGNRRRRRRRGIQDDIDRVPRTSANRKLSFQGHESCALASHSIQPLFDVRNDGRSRCAGGERPRCGARKEEMNAGDRRAMLIPHRDPHGRCSPRRGRRLSFGSTTCRLSVRGGQRDGNSDPGNKNTDHSRPSNGSGVHRRRRLEREGCTLARMSLPVSLPGGS